MREIFSVISRQIAHPWLFANGAKLCSGQEVESRHFEVNHVDLRLGFPVRLRLFPLFSVSSAAYLSEASRTTQAKDTFFCFAISPRETLNK
jgi:hypothetical protein